MTHLPGKFVWFEHFSNDIARARAFYAGLFGWHTAAMPMGEQRYPTLMNGTEAIGGLRASTVIGAYCVSKAADVQLARNLAAELGPSGIRVNCISPGLVKTDFAKALWDDPEMKEQREEQTPLRRIGVPDDIAGAAVMLASRAGAWLTGQNIVVDGGVTAV